MDDSATVLARLPRVLRPFFRLGARNEGSPKSQHP